MKYFSRLLSDYSVISTIKNANTQSITDGAAFLVPRQCVKKPRKIYVDCIEPEALKKAKYLTKTLVRKNDACAQYAATIDDFINSMDIIKNNMDFKKDFSNLIFLEKIPLFMKYKDFHLFSDQKFICNFYRENNFIFTEFWVDFIVRSLNSKKFFDEKPKLDLTYNIFKDIKSNLADVQPSRMKDLAGFGLLKEKTLKRNANKDYFGSAPSISHPHFVLVRSQKNKRDMFGNVYCPISHGIKVGFSVLSSHISEINRAAGGAGWGLGFGSDLKSPLCCYVVVLANDYYITVKYQLNTLQLFNSKGTWNQAEYSPKKYYFNKSAPNKKSASYMCGFIEEAMTLD